MEKYRETRLSHRSFFKSIPVGYIARSNTKSILACAGQKQFRSILNRVLWRKHRNILVDFSSAWYIIERKGKLIY